ncbi:MAG: sulfite exporter TauE/SafE family protein [Gammaproteobacteria bacterium]|nr:MAG: sulfite exporter TauE/SafE family protein [Gammaproteobacteria bacterium]
MQARDASFLPMPVRALVIGLVAGLGGGLFSLGGGTLTIPLMMGWLGLGPFAARGTALAAALLPTLLSAWLYAQAGRVDWIVVALVAIPAMLVTPWVAARTERFDGDRLKRWFGLVVIFGAAMLILREELLGSRVIADGWRWLYLPLVGVIEGLVAGGVGISGGPVLAPLLVLGLGMPQQLAQGCALAARIPAVTTGLAENLRHRHVRFGLLPGLVGGGLLGAWLGSRLALALPELHLRMLFAAVLAVIGLRYALAPRR